MRRSRDGSRLFAVIFVILLTKNIITAFVCNPNINSFGSRVSSAKSLFRGQALYGIKGFRRWFSEEFPKAYTEIDMTKDVEEFDHVLIGEVGGGRRGEEEEEGGGGVGGWGDRTK